jgi:hypothetical protein
MQIETGPWRPLDWDHEIFEKKVPSSLSIYAKFWLLLRDIMLWTIWIERIGLAFNSYKWDVEKVQQTTWQWLLAYARIAWEKALYGKERREESLHLWKIP